MEHKHDSKMMWGMMLACALPILFVSFAGAGRSSPIVWGVVGLGLMVLFHWVVMRWLHKDKKSPPAPDEPPTKANNKSPDENKPSGH